MHNQPINKLSTYLMQDLEHFFKNKGMDHLKPNFMSVLTKITDFLIEKEQKFSKIVASKTTAEKLFLSILKEIKTNAEVTMPYIKGTAETLKNDLEIDGVQTYRNLRTTLDHAQPDIYNRPVHLREKQSIKSELTGEDMNRLMPKAQNQILEVLAPVGLGGDEAQLEKQGLINNLKVAKDKGMQNIIFPIGPGHWRGVFISKNKNNNKYTLTMFDSFYKDTTTKDRNKYLIANTIEIKSILQQAGIIISETKMHGPKTQQKDLFSCGDFVLAEMHRFVQEINNKQRTNLDLDVNFAKLANTGNNNNELRKYTIEKSKQLYIQPALSNKLTAVNSKVETKMTPIPNKYAFTKTEQTFISKYKTFLSKSIQAEKTNEFRDQFNNQASRKKMEKEIQTKIKQLINKDGGITDKKKLEQLDQKLALILQQDIIDEREAEQKTFKP